MGDIFYQILKLTDFSEENFDWDSYEKIVKSVNKEKLTTESENFFKKFKVCVDSLEIIENDISNYYKNNSESKSSSNLSDLIKYAFEVNKLMNCFNEISTIIKDINNI
jgi:hypothetical protein